jgi:arginyl-tRNA synthetase
MMRFAEGKMSSRKGNIIAGDELIEIVKENLKEKFEKSRVEDKEEREFLIEKVAIGAIKYAVLKQSIGKDVIFDLEKAISVDGDSGPYLQYTHARISGIVNKNENKLVNISEKNFDLSSLEINQNNKNLIINILKYEKVLSETINEFAPQKMLSYLVTLAHSFNSFYNNEKIEGSQNNIFLASKVKKILADGLELLGIHAPDRM